MRCRPMGNFVNLINISNLSQLSECDATALSLDIHFRFVIFILFGLKAVPNLRLYLPHSHSCDKTAMMTRKSLIHFMEFFFN